MRKLLLATAAVVIMAAPAMATPSSSASIDITANNAAACTVTTSAVSPVSVSLTGVGEQAIGDFTYTCNDPDGFHRTIESDNGGKLVRFGSGGGAGNEVPYLFDHGNANLLVSDTSLALPYEDDPSGLVFVGGQTGTASVTINGPVDNLFAGDFDDTITVTIAPN